MTKLEHYFLEIPDSRRPAGRHYKLSKLLLALTLGVLSGYQGCRELARFMRHNQEELIVCGIFL
ncbi:MAG: transposase family protein [Pseudomonadales bacterium]|nr:transposase family protein [Pseudomonadales bacterium]